MGPRRGIQPAIFGVAVLSFLLPFANVSCGSEGEGLPAPVDETNPTEGRAELKGYQLVIGRDVSDAFDELTDSLEMGDPQVRVGADPMAAIALLAGLAGLGISLLAPSRRRARHAIACGAAGTAAIAILGVAPAVGATGLFGVSWDYGYWTCLALFLGATWVSYEEHRRRLRAAARRE